MCVEWGWERWKERHWPIAIVKQLFIYTADSYSQPNNSWNRNELATIASAMSQYGKFSCAQILKLEENFINRVSEVLLEWYWYHATPSINQMLYRLRWLLVLLVLHTYYFANYESKWALAANSDATINIDNELELATKLTTSTITSTVVPHILPVIFSLQDALIWLRPSGSFRLLGGRRTNMQLTPSPWRQMI